MSATPAPTRAEAAALDAADGLASFRDRFLLDDGGPIYLDGHSLGRLPRATIERIGRTVVDEWGRGLVRSWGSEWIDLPRTVGDRLAATVLGARSGEVLVADSTSVNLYKLARAALDADPSGRRVIVTDRANFPTDRYILEGLGEVRFVDDDPDASAIASATSAGDVALVSLSLVAYRSGALLDLTGITAIARAAGAMTLWDLSHAAGAVPIDLEGAGVDLAVGCTYKYLNAGPGAPAFLYVRQDQQGRLVQPIRGWFGAAAQFAMGPVYEPADGIDRFAVGTPPVLGLVAVDEGVGVIAEAGIEALRRKSLALTDLVITLADQHLAPLGFDVGTPRAHHQRGSHVALRHPQAWRLCRALIEDLGVVPDFREPDVIRFGLTAVNTRFVDAWDAVDRLRRAADERAFERFPVERTRVT
ncbi:MAG TPA: kynureninase [Acidimicrobiales bacterium]|nr:kynureninase [Acidimicrobiales bacterium]